MLAAAAVAAALAAALQLTVLLLTNVESSRVAKSESPARFQLYVVTSACRIVGVTCSFVLPRNPLRCLSRVVRSTAVVKISLMLSAVGAFLTARRFAATNDLDPQEVSLSRALLVHASSARKRFRTRTVCLDDQR